ncbi:MAG: diguanylate cyclase [Proteobacteria bacterium]|nr:diguanylate cyclase [Pseudomonadota bacterium]
MPGRISLFVLAATLVTSLAVTAISLRAVQDFLHAKIDAKFPELLHSASDKLELWFGQRASEVQVFASTRILADDLPRLAREPGTARGRRAMREIHQFLSHLHGSSPQYASLFLLDDRGRRLLSVGDEITLPEDLTEWLATEATGVSEVLELDGRFVQLVSAGVESRGGRRTGSLHAVLVLEALSGLLATTDVGGGELFVVGSEGDVLVSSGGPSHGRRFERDLPEPEIEPTVVDYNNGAGERVVGSAVSFPRFGWTLVVEESYDQAFQPVVSSIRRTFGINLAIVVLFGLGAVRIAKSIARPIADLSKGVQRFAEGETDVVIAGHSATPEIRLLIRTFNAMTARLHQKTRELEQSRREVQQANVRLTSKNDELSQLNEVLEQLSITDGLTKLHNHRYFQDHLSREVKRASRNEEPLALILIDIDHFKSWNDRLGHAGGDEILRKIAAVMSQLVRETDLLARYGGEEFAVLAGDTDLEGAVALAEKLRARVSNTSFFLEPPSDRHQVTVSIGVAVFRGDKKRLFNDADRALYRAKAAGRDCVVAADEEE